jgi:heme-degrading monooxygenase HmoA
MEFSMPPSAASEDASAPFVVINTFTPKPGQQAAFLEAQLAGLGLLRGRIDGLRGSRMHRALDSEDAILVSVFESRAAFERFRDSELFAAHRQRISPVLEKTAPGFYAPVYEAGTV